MPVTERQTAPRRRSIVDALKVIGPGFAVAATGVGAGDVITAGVAGSQYGTAILWAVVVGAVLKLTLNEGIARWQLATSTTLLQGWGSHLGRWAVAGFLMYLLTWTVLVAGALMSACGLAAHSLFPGLSVRSWGIIHSIVALILIYVGRYALFERVMKVLIGLMFVTVVASAFIVKPDVSAALSGLIIPTIPSGSAKFLLGVIGGIGGSVTLLSYNYWLRERGWNGLENRSLARLDLGAAYTFIGIFGVAIMIVGAGVRPDLMTGSTMALEIARRVEGIAGTAARWVFLTGFWGTVFTSMLGVWQGVPYIFADTVRVLKGDGGEVSTDSRLYRIYLLFVALPPMAMLLIERPVWLVLVYSVAGAFFMPFLAVTLLLLNNRRNLPAEARNGWLVNSLLGMAILLFLYLLYTEVAEVL